MPKLRFLNLLTNAGLTNVGNPIDVRNILFITLSNIGDAILTTPTLEALHDQFPNAKVDIVCDMRSAIIFQHCPYLGQLIFKDKQAGWSGLIKLVKHLRQRKYDIAVDLRTDGILYLIRANIKAHKLSNRETIKMHSAEKHFAVLKNIVNVPMPPTKFWLSEKEAAFADHALRNYGQQKILALGVGANFTGKIWPLNSFLALVNALKDYFDVVFIFGDKNDARLLGNFASKSQLPMIDYCGKLNLLETAACLEKADYFIGNDSGLGHVASALNVPTFTVFGVGQPERYKPWGKHAKWYQDPQLEIKNVDASMIAKMIIPTLTQSK